ncbi:MAG: glycosyltransferase [Alphaproteobacteria bacterium]|nr:glycosyltransferase [Alphaproteobacteria bacterium]
MMNENKRLRVAALIDLPRSAQSGGHVKCWERMAAAASTCPAPLDLTVFFSGQELKEEMGEHAHLRQLPPVFSTANLKFLPYVPDHTDLAPLHPRLARELSQFDVLHTTDGYFAFARTAERVSRRFGIPLVTSFHTDTPSYARIFTQKTIEDLLGKTWLARKLIDDLHLPERQEKSMKKRLQKHVRRCRAALVTREEDHELAENVLGKENVYHMRLGVDRAMFGQHRRDRAALERDYNIPEGRLVVLFVGRIDVGKNIFTLIGAIENLIAEGLPLHLITAGIGPAMEDVKKRLKDHASVPGFVSPDNLAQLYASVDVLALSSEVEIRSMAGVEAMASGCPVLVSAKSGIAQLFNHTPAMEVVTGGVEAWTKALRDFAANPSQRKKMGQDAVKYGCEQIASWQDVLAEDMFSVWKKASLSQPAS